MDSSLSSVPPVCPSPRPDSCGTAAPQAATSGASGRVILSPTPPVECLSTSGRPTSPSASTSPESIIAWVQRLVSAASIPFRRIAMARAAICSSATSPRVYAATTQSICSSVRRPPSRLAMITSTALIPTDPWLTAATLVRRDPPADSLSRKPRLAAPETEIRGAENRDSPCRKPRLAVSQTETRRAENRDSPSGGQVGRAERLRQQLRQRGRAARRVHEALRAAELVEHLTAPPARQEQPAVPRPARHRHEAPAAGEPQLSDQGALGAEREPVRGVLDVAAGDHAAVVAERRGPHREPRVRRVRRSGRGDGGCAQGVPVHLGHSPGIAQRSDDNRPPERLPP